MPIEVSLHTLLIFTIQSLGQLKLCQSFLPWDLEALKWIFNWIFQLEGTVLQDEIDEEDQSVFTLSDQDPFSIAKKGALKRGRSRKSHFCFWVSCLRLQKPLPFFCDTRGFHTWLFVYCERATMLRLKRIKFCHTEACKPIVQLQMKWHYLDFQSLYHYISFQNLQMAYLNSRSVCTQLYQASTKCSK